MVKQKILTLEEAQKMMAENNGNLDLTNSDFKSLPKGLKVPGCLWLQNSAIKELPEYLQVGGSLDLSHTPIRKLPDNLTVGRHLCLWDTRISRLPDSLSVNSDLDLSLTPITELPSGLTIGGHLFLNNSRIAKLPDGLIVCGGLYLHDTEITELPNGLVVGERLNITDTPISNLPEDLTIGGVLSYQRSGITSEQAARVRRLKDGDCGNGNYIYADGTLTPVREVRHVNGYTLYVGKLPGKNVVYDGEVYAHCRTFRGGIADIAFKRVKDRGAKQYRDIDRDAPIPLEDAKTMYRVITGACQQGTENFVQSLEATGKLKDAYTVNEMLKVTKGQYGAETFAKFFA